MEKNKLSLDSLQKDNLKFESTIRVDLSNGDYLNIRPFISREDIESIINDYQGFLLDEDVRKYIKNNELFLYLQCFVILNNSDILEGLTLNDYTDKLKFTKLMSTNAVLFDEIMNSFDSKSLDLIIKKFSEIIEIAKEIEKIQNKNKENKTKEE